MGNFTSHFHLKSTPTMPLVVLTIGLSGENLSLLKIHAPIYGACTLSGQIFLGLGPNT